MISVSLYIHTFSQRRFVRRCVVASFVVCRRLSSLLLSASFVVRSCRRRSALFVGGWSSSSSPFELRLIIHASGPLRDLCK